MRKMPSELKYRLADEIGEVVRSTLSGTLNLMQPEDIREVFERAKLMACCYTDNKFPGKFEGEGDYASYFYYYFGMGDSWEMDAPEYGEEGVEETAVMRFDIDEIDRGLFPDLKDQTEIKYYTSTQGFWTEVP